MLISKDLRTREEYLLGLIETMEPVVQEAKDRGLIETE